MAARIRLRRVGAKKQPYYRLVVADSRFPRDGRFIEIIGHYNPRTEPCTVDVNHERARYWLEKGATPTDSVRKILALSGVIERNPPPSPSQKGRGNQGRSDMASRGTQE
ncbi:MAG: 30S ribosomal protein S16 [Armatimonadetes bacterium]|nr:30S ribosomal protein S16 [Armatimonadota bacterium]